MFENFRADVRYTLKWLLRSPGFTAVAVASLALGIGFNTALFSIIDALLLRPLPVDRPDRLVDVYTRGADGDTYATNSYPDFIDFRAQNQVFTAMLGYSPAIAAVKTSDQSRMALGEVVTGNYFDLLGVRAAVGRTLQPNDDTPGAPRRRGHRPPDLDAGVRRRPVGRRQDDPDPRADLHDRRRGAARIHRHGADAPA